MKDLREILTGISGILVTPYDDKGEIDPVRLEPIINRVIEAGVHLPVVNGNTSEFYALTLDEALSMSEAVIGMAGGRAPILAGVGRSVRDACRLARSAADNGAAAIMVHQPPDPFVSPRGTIDYVKAIADASNGLPLVLYIRNDAMGTAAISELCALPSVVGVKWATPNPVNLSNARELSDPEIVWIGGLAETWAPAFYAVGARGFTSGLINIWPERSVAIHSALEKGNYSEARQLIAEMRIFEDVRAEELSGTNVTGVKAALISMDQDCGATRPPSAWPLTLDQQSQINEFLKANRLI